MFTRVLLLKVNSNERAFVGESSSYSYEEREFYYVLGDDVRKRYEKDFSSIDRREKIFRERRKERETKTFHQRERERGFGESSNKKLFCCDFFDWWFQNFLFRFPFFPLLLLFFQL